MFTYNLRTKKVTKGQWLPTLNLRRSSIEKLNNAAGKRREADDKLYIAKDIQEAGPDIQRNPDAVVALFAFLEPDTFSFRHLQSTPMGVKRGEEVEVVKGVTQDKTMEVTSAILLDPFVQGISVQSSKRAHTDNLHVTLMDPNNTLLSLINPGDWIVCWMCDNQIDAANIRRKLQNREYAGLNDFRNGLKFIGKALAPRIQQRALPSGALVKTCTLQATAFSELDAALYYDPQINSTGKVDRGLEFMQDIANTINVEFNGIARSINAILAVLLPVLLGCPPRQGPNPNQPMLVPRPIAEILGFPQAKSFMDVLTAFIGVQKFGDRYIPKFKSGIEKEELKISVETTVPKTTPANLEMPVSGTKTSNYGMRVRNGKNEFHPGTDWAAPIGTPILAAAKGVVTRANGMVRGYGNSLEIDHQNGLTTLYAHCDQLLVKAGDTVVAGQNVASVGNTGLSTGPHLHFEVRRLGNTVDPLSQLPNSFANTQAKSTLISEPTKSTIYPHPNIYSTGNSLRGAVNPQIAPFNNVPVWSVLEQHLIPIANEMYSCLRLNINGGISPHLIIRQIPFTSDEMTQNDPENYTAFRELPRWKVEPELVKMYDTGKSNSMRVNYVQVQVSDGVPSGDTKSLLRAVTTPRWDDVDIARNGLKAFIAQVSATNNYIDLGLGQQWTDMVTDRMIGAHLKLSGNISLVGIQEPIATGDNLEYDNFVYHIEGIEHSFQVNPGTGDKSFSTTLAISNGVPAGGLALPEIAIRKFASKDTSSPKLVEFVRADMEDLGEYKITEAKQKATYTLSRGEPAAAVHSINPAANVQED